MRKLLLAILGALSLVAGTQAEGTGAPVELAFRVAACGMAAAPQPRVAATTPRWMSIELTRPEALQPFAPGWSLLVDQIRFSGIRADVTTPAGTVHLGSNAASLPNSVGLGNLFTLAVPVAGADVRGLCISVRSADSLSLLRSVKAMTPHHLAVHRTDWLVIAALVSGVLLCALAYNLFLLFWLKNRFQGWYVIWLTAGIGYTHLWSGTAAMLLPQLGVEWSIRLNLILISVLIGSGSAFFFDFIEPHATPRWLRRIGLANAVALPFLGLMAAAETWVPAALGDRVLNLAFLAATLCIGTGVVIGITRRSRAVWFYLAGWSPPVFVFALRVARNFGALSQSDLIDKMSFVALAFEAVVLSLAIADRFRSLLRERDTAAGEREMLRRVATTDPMTGLYNRAAFQHQMTTLQDEPSDADLILFDLDDLKQTNDLAGHDAGDALLVEVGKRLAAVAVPGTFVARLGGDEFAVLLRGAEPAALNPFLLLVEQSATRAFTFAGRRLSASLSAGHARWSPSDGDGGGLYKKADLALYGAKASGRGCWRGFLPTMLDEQEARQASLAMLRQALAQGELVLHHQPIVDLQSGERVYDEALLRWAHPERGVLGPDVFAGAWDDAGTATAVQDFVIRLALDHLQRFKASGAPLHALSVNFLAGQLQGQEGAAQILELLRVRDLPTSALVVEVTETVVLGRPGGPVVECLRALRRAGVRVALDDFGTGYASLVHLRDLSADILKIDRSFVMGVPADIESAKIVRAIVALAHSLGQCVIAEGVETEPQREFLRELGCDFGQGYLFGRPVPFPGTGKAIAA